MSNTTLPQNQLTITDPTTGQTITLPIDPIHNTINAKLFEQIRLVPTKPPAASPTDTVPLRMYDPGYKNTTVCKTAISCVDGKNGKLYYRGYDVEELAEKSSFLEVAYLLIYGKLPNQHELNEWNYAVLHHTYIHTELERQMMTFRYDAHPMGMLISTMASLSTFHPEANPALQGENLYFIPKYANAQEAASIEAKAEKAKKWDTRNRHIYRILGKTATIAANTYRHRMGRNYNYPMPQKAGKEDYCQNLIYMMEKLNDPLYEPNPQITRILDKLFIVLAEHGSNCSTVTLRHLISSGVDPYTAIAGSMAALFGERKCHSVIDMLQTIGTRENILHFLNRVKRKETSASSLYESSQSFPARKSTGKPVRLMGFGHRIYKTHDPRVKIVRQLAFELAQEIKSKDDLFELAGALEEAALKDDYFTQRKLYPNIDYWTAIILHMLKFPKDMFPVLLALPRTAGFLAHWIESIDDPEFKIFRPRQIYTGPAQLAFFSPTERSSTICEKKLDYVPGDPNAAKRRDTTADESVLDSIEAMILSTQEAIESIEPPSSTDMPTDPQSESWRSWFKRTLFGINQTSLLNEQLKKNQLELLKILEQQKSLVQTSAIPRKYE